jgi:hypothetical protein
MIHLKKTRIKQSFFKKRPKCTASAFSEIVIFQCLLKVISASGSASGISFEIIITG